MLIFIGRNKRKKSWYDDLYCSDGVAASRPSLARLLSVLSEINIKVSQELSGVNLIRLKPREKLDSV